MISKRAGEEPGESCRGAGSELEGIGRGAASEPKSSGKGTRRQLAACRHRSGGSGNGAGREWEGKQKVGKEPSEGWDGEDVSGHRSDGVSSEEEPVSSALFTNTAVLQKQEDRCLQIVSEFV